MSLHESVDDQALRVELADWLEQHLCGEFAPLRGNKGPGDPHFDAALARRWEQTLAGAGWTALGWPAAQGGRGWSIGRQMLWYEEYARCGGPARLGHIGEQLLAPTLLAHGTAALQRRFLPGIRQGTEFWAQGYSEPGAGSDLAAVRTRARRDDAALEWVIDGQKVWTSWAHVADWIFVLARTEVGSERHHGLSLLLVPLRQSGIQVRPIRQITGGSEFNEVFFDGARTDITLHLGPLGEGWKVAMALLGFERGVSTLGQQAHFRQELDLVMAVARQNGAAQDALLRQRIAASSMQLQTLRYHALRLLGEAGAPDGQAALVAKYLWSNWRRDLGVLAMDVLGAGLPLPPDDAASRALHTLWLEGRADTIYAGTNEIQLNLIAERGLGLPR